jgi:2-polyprenyl-6-methoxyphenol hydroxylase-like FAD-dependent oxidoreductase
VSAFDLLTNGRYVSLPRSALAAAIYARVEHDVETIFDDSVVGLAEHAGGVDVTFERTAPRTFDLVVGADGLHSTVRALAFGDAHRFETPLGYYTAAFVTEGYPHRDEGAYVSYTVAGRQVARYALRDGRSAFFMVFRADAVPDLRAGGDVHAQRALLRRVYGGAGWECDAILAAMDRSDDLYFDGVAQVHVPSWSAGDRVVLLGDAASCPSLLAGQGSAFALAGAYVLAEALAASPADQAGALAEYESRFRPFVERKQRAALRFGGWFAPRTALGVRVRNLATSLAGAPVVGRVVVGRAFRDEDVLAG